MGVLRAPGGEERLFVRAPPSKTVKITGWDVPVTYSPVNETARIIVQLLDDEMCEENSTDLCRMSCDCEFSTSAATAAASAAAAAAAADAADATACSPDRKVCHVICPSDLLWTLTPSAVMDEVHAALGLEPVPAYAWLSGVVAVPETSFYPLARMGLVDKRTGSLMMDGTRETASTTESNYKPAAEQQQQESQQQQQQLKRLAGECSRLRARVNTLAAEGGRGEWQVPLRAYLSKMLL